MDFSFLSRYPELNVSWYNKPQLRRPLGKGELLVNLIFWFAEGELKAFFMFSLVTDNLDKMYESTFLPW